MTTDHEWRRTAAGRPGYATYPTTAPGNPSWWLRHGQQPPTRPAPTNPGPAIDHTACGASWCPLCHIGTSEQPGPLPAAPPAHPARFPWLLRLTGRTRR